MKPPVGSSLLAAALISLWVVIWADCPVEQPVVVVAQIV